MLNLQFEQYPFKYRDGENGRYIFCQIRRKYIFLTKEEWVRQNLIYYLIHRQGYPKGLISVEKGIIVNQLRKRYDIVVYDKTSKPWMLIECKEPDVAITEATLQQLLRYHSVLQCPFWMLSNGRQNYCATVQNGAVQWLSSLPSYDF